MKRYCCRVDGSIVLSLPKASSLTGLPNVLCVHVRHAGLLSSYRWIRLPTIQGAGFGYVDIVCRNAQVNRLSCLGHMEHVRVRGG